MSQKALFERLGAPLRNSRWSWGSVRPTDGTVFLRVWQDEVKRIDSKQNLYVRITDLPSDNDGPGFNERLEHVALIKDGASLLMVMCRARNPEISPREMLDFNKQELFLGGDHLEDENGCLWVEIRKRVPLREELL